MKYRNVLGNEFRGQIGKALVASSWKGRGYVKEYVVPRDPKTELQEQHRGFWSAAGPAWRALRPSQQAFYKGLAVDMTGYNLFLQRHVRSLREGTTPEVPVVLAWSTADGRPVRAGWLVVRKDGREVFVESLERGSGEIALSAADAPYALAIRKGGLGDAVGSLETIPVAGDQRVVASEPLCVSVVLTRG